MALRTILADDELPARENLKELLKPYSEQITVIAEAVDGNDALEKIRALAPDLLFLDIHMPWLDAFQLIERMPSPLPRIIFTTAYDKYAVNAFDVNAVDYLLKPVSQARLKQAIEKIPDSDCQVSLQLSAIKKTITEMKRTENTRIQVKTGDVISFVNLTDICYFEGEDYLTAVITPSKKYLINTPLYELETTLPAGDFIRIHRSAIININFIREIHKAGNGKLTVIMKEPVNTKFTISRSHIPLIRELFHSL